MLYSEDQIMHMRHIVICGLSGCTIFSYIIPLPSRLSKNKIIKHKMCVLIPSAPFFWNSYSKKKWVSYYNKCVLFFI